MSPLRNIADPGLHRADLQALVDLGMDAIFIHNVGQKQEALIDMAARTLLQ